LKNGLIKYGVIIMISIEWCKQQRNGLELIEPNNNISHSYIKMAEESIIALNQLTQSRIWTATATYYIFYYSLYSLMMRIGIKCEIHNCSLLYMKQFFNQFYNKKDMEMIKKAFSARIDLQYYADRPVDDQIIEETKKYCKDFYIKTKDILSKITEKQINEMREQLK